MMAGLPAAAECAHCGKPMVLVEGLYYVHLDTGETCCPEVPGEDEP